MIRMENSWQFNIVFMVLLITSCFGSPVPPNMTLANKDDVSKNKELPEYSKNSEGIPAEIIKLSSVPPKLDEANAKPTEPVVDSTKTATSVSNKNNVILNFNVNTNSTADSNKDVNKAVSGTDIVSASVSEVNPGPASPQIDSTASDAAAAGEQVKSEGDIQLTADINNVKNDTNGFRNGSDNSGMENLETKVNGNEVTNETDESNRTTEDDKVTSGGDEVSQEKNITNDSEGSLGLPIVDKPNGTDTETEKGTPNNSEPEKKKDEEPKIEPTAGSESNTLIETQKPSADIESNKPTDDQELSTNSESNMPNDNQKQSTDSESNTQTDNQDPSAVVVNKPPTEVSGQTTVNVVASKSSTTTTSSSFNVYMGDPSSSYAQSSDPEYTNNQYPGNDNGNDVSYDDDISEDVDNAPYNGRGVYKNEPKKLNGEFTDDTDSHFFAYFLTIMVTAIVFYLLFHNKQRVGQALGCIKKNDRLKKIKEDKSKEPLLKSSSTDG